MKNFAQLIKKIEQATEILNNPDTDLEESFKIYAETLPLIKEAQSALTNFELEIEEIANQPAALEK